MLTHHGNTQPQIDQEEHTHVGGRVSGTPAKATVSADLYAMKVTEVGSVTYIATAVPGSSQSDPVWQAKKIDTTTGVVTTWADGNTAFDNVATDLTSLTYS